MDTVTIEIKPNEVFENLTEEEVGKIVKFLVYIAEKEEEVEERLENN